MLTSGTRRTSDLDAPLTGADGNERLTAIAGAVLFVLFAVEGVTIVFLHPLLRVHFFVGMLLIGPVALKIGSTGYRFARYYAGAPTYRRKGPPAPLLRLLGPVVVVSSVAVVGSGAALAFTPPVHGLLVELHKASFVIWFGAMTIHVLAYIWRVPGLLLADVGAARAGSARGRHARVAAALTSPAGRAARWVLLACALAAGLVIAAATVHLATPWASVAGRG